VGHTDYLDDKQSKAIADALTKVLADTFVLYFKTHAYHWNVEGPHFKSLHELFGEQYTEMWEATDEIAERIRALNSYAPVSFADLVKTASLTEETGQRPDAHEMLIRLADDHAALVADALYPALRAAEEAGDEATVDMMVGRIEVHEKTTWMLRSTAKE